MRFFLLIKIESRTLKCYNILKSKTEKMNLFLYFFVFLFGSAIGSFLNVVIYRLEKNESFVVGRSYCPNCHHQLSWRDLFPILSFILLSGKCRYCKKPISFQYPLVEMATAVLFVLVVYFSFPDMFLAVFWIIIASLLMVIFVYDLKYYVIPSCVVYLAIALIFIYNLIYSLFIVNDIGFLVQSLIAGILPAFFFLLIYIVSRKQWIGEGDIEIAFLMGFLLGQPKIYVALFLAFLIGAIIGLGLIFLKRKNFSSQVPFAPFLITGTFIALFWGQKIADWYLNLLI